MTDRDDRQSDDAEGSPAEPTAEGSDHAETGGPGSTQSLAETEAELKEVLGMQRADDWIFTAEPADEGKDGGRED